jgi:hypothetical protein
LLQKTQSSARAREKKRNTGDPKRQVVSESRQINKIKNQNVKILSPIKKTQ